MPRRASSHCSKASRRPSQRRASMVSSGTTSVRAPGPAGLTRGAIYSNFGTKEELLLAVLEWYGQRSLEAYVVASQEEEWEPSAGARTWAEIVHRDPSLALLHVEFRLHALRDPKFRRQL